MIEKLFSNPGEKIKTLAIINFWIILISCVICAVIYGDLARSFLIFFSFLFAGTIGNYIITLPLYGFGELIEKTSNLNAVSQNDSSACSDKQNEIDDALRF